MSDVVEEDERITKDNSVRWAECFRPFEEEVDHLLGGDDFTHAEREEFLGEVISWATRTRQNYRLFHYREAGRKWAVAELAKQKKAERPEAQQDDKAH